MVGVGKSRLESNPIPATDAQRAQTYLVLTRTQRPPQRLRQNCVWVSSEEVWVCSGLLQGQGLWVQQTWMWHKPSWRRSPLTPPQSHQNLHRTGEIDSWRAQTEPCVHQDPGERSSDPTKDLTQTCPWVSWSLWRRPGLAAACCSSGGTECSSAWMGPFEGGNHYLYYLHHSLASDQITGREYSTTLQQKIGLKIYLDAISKTTEWFLFISKANHSISQ